MTTRVAAGRPLLIVRATDRGAGVDPLSLTIAYNHVLVGAAAYDPISGIAAFPLPNGTPVLKPGATRAILVASDYQEAKNVSTTGPNIMPNTRFKPVTIHAVRGTTVQWLAPSSGACAQSPERLVVAVGSSRGIRSVRFYDGAKPLGSDRAVAGLAAVDWPTKAARRGVHVLKAVAVDRSGHAVSATRAVRVCR
jgi:hypothetical protein